MILNLEKQLAPLLEHADECWIAVALISNHGYEFLKKHLSPEAKVNIIVGTDLPTPISVLKKLKEDAKTNNFRCKIFDPNQGFFHPKLYIIKSNGRFSAFVGSANFSEGGLSNNKELSIKVEDERDVKSLLQSFFLPYFNKKSLEITQGVIDKYQKLNDIRIGKLAEIREALKNFRSEVSDPTDLTKIDFSNQFFKFDHYNAFAFGKPILHEADSEREKVGERLKDLDEQLWPDIKKNRWDLSKHPKESNLCSTTNLRQAKSFNIKELAAVWLHYGKGKDELNSQKKDEYESSDSFIHNIRMQVIITASFLGVWLVIGKKFGSIKDREVFKKNLRENHSTEEEYYNIVKNLPEWEEALASGLMTTIW